MSRLSILIPYLGKPKLLEETLVSVLENRPEDSEVLVVLGRHYDDPYDLGDEIRFLPGQERTGLAGCLNLGFRMSRAEIVHVLLCGTEVSEGWADGAIDHFADPRVACVAPLLVDSQDRARVLAAGVSYHPGGRMQLLGQTNMGALRPTDVLGPHPAAAFYRKAAVEYAGWFDTQAGDRLAMLDLALAFEHVKFRTVLEPRCQVRLLPGSRDGSGAFRQALDAERFFWRWAASRGWLRSLALHAVTVLGEGCRTLTSPSIAAWTAGRLFGCGAIGSHRRCRSRLQRVMSGIPENAAPAGPHFSGSGSRAVKPVLAGRGR